ncbi:MAG: tRNA pseudouridine(38-40) synthase TruA [Moraxellaceae bacterium]|nr:MAG: tRNA pseudouridine(38-40) synthase TruA [Moraxellaceae bacterium]
MRIAMGVEYDGSPYHGWQRQGHDTNTVQQKLDDALSKVADSKISVVCAGRTDSGVHGVGQVVHFDTDVNRSEKAWVFGSNTNMPADITVHWAVPVVDDFHARFSALSRRYRYVIYNSAVKPGLANKYVTWDYRPLDVERMQQAANHLIGAFDFSSFRAAGCQAKTATREIQSIHLFRKGALVVMDIQANAFLQNMVRNVAGVLMAIGSGNKPIEWALEVLEAKDRTKGGNTAHPYGLYFMKVEYPEQFNIPYTTPEIPFMPLSDTIYFPQKLNQRVLEQQKS